MAKSFRNIAVVSLSTVGSRVLGLLRDVLLFAVLGAGIWNSAFILAFTLPNLFRRLLGEGALTSALIPVFSDVLRSGGKEGAFRFFNRVLVRLLFGLIAIVSIGMIVLSVLSNSGMLSERWEWGGHFSVILLPYMLLICVAAVVSAVLNVLGRFAISALTPVFLNLSIIGSILIALYYGADAKTAVYFLCGGVLFGGLLQFLIPAFDLWRQGWKPKFESSHSPEINQLWLLFLPGLLGAAILQVNILISRLLAYSIDDSAASILYLSSRLMELPLGVFTISVATVFFPILSKAISENDSNRFSSGLTQGMRLVVGISFPAGVGLLVLGEPILEVLFRYGRFDVASMQATVPLIAIYGLGLPFYSAATFATRGFHAQKDMKTPVKIAGICLLVNLIGSVIAMQFFGAAGLASANVLAAIVQAVLLWRALSKGRSEVGFSSLSSAFLKILLAGLGMGFICFLGRYLIYGFELSTKLEAGLIVGLFVPGGAAFYFGCLALLKFQEMDFLRELVVRLLPKARFRG